MIKEKIVHMVENNSGKIIGSLIGLFLAIFILSIGFFKTMFIVALIVLGYAIGSKIDKRESLLEFLKTLLGIDR